VFPIFPPLPNPFSAIKSHFEKTLPCFYKILCQLFFQSSADIFAKELIKWFTKVLKVFQSSKSQYTDPNDDFSLEKNSYFQKHFPQKNKLSFKHKNLNAKKLNKLVLKHKLFLSIFL